MSQSNVVTCYAITHAGEGERGEKVEISVRGAKGTEWYAEEAAEYFQGQEMRQQGMSEEDIGAFHRTSQVIEVEGHPWHPEPVRYAVWCEVVRRYEATRV